MNELSIVCDLSKSSIKIFIQHVQSLIEFRDVEFKNYRIEENKLHITFHMFDLNQEASNTDYQEIIKIMNETKQEIQNIKLKVGDIIAEDNIIIAIDFVKNRAFRKLTQIWNNMKKELLQLKCISNFLNLEERKFRITLYNTRNLFHFHPFIIHDINNIIFNLKLKKELIFCDNLKLITTFDYNCIHSIE